MQESTQYEWRELVDRLRDEDASCVIRNGAETRVFRERGVKDLFRLLETDPAFLAGALVANARRDIPVLRWSRIAGLFDTLFRALIAERGEASCAADRTTP